MIVVLSPTKRLVLKEQTQQLSDPIFLDKTRAIMEELQKLSVEELMKVLKVKENLAVENHERYQKFQYDTKGYSALTCYQGLQYQYMNLDMNAEDWKYANKHIRILDALYGVLQPDTSIYPYRLDMLAKLKINDNSLYQYWGCDIYDYLIEELPSHKEKKILCLASKEYAQMIVPYAKDELVIVDFYVVKQGEYKMEATASKMARGRMMGFLLEEKIDKVEDVKKFCEDGYAFNESMSDDSRLVFYKVV